MATMIRADNLGSFLRPSYLLQAKQQGVPADELRALEDRAIAEVLTLQEEAGLPIVTDGEFRRNLFYSTVVETLDGFDPTGSERFHRDEQGNEIHFGVPTPIAKLRRKAPLVDVEFAFTKQHTTRPIKVTMPTPSLLRFYFKDAVSLAAYPSRDSFAEDLIAFMAEDARALAAAGAAYLQLDAPHYTYWDRIRPDDPLGSRREMIALDNRVFAGLKDVAPNVVTGLHLCRGNYRSLYTGTKPYDEYAEIAFGEPRVDRLLLEYDDYRSGDFTPLRYVREDVTVVLGLVTTKRSELESQDELLRRIEEAARYVPLERLALSTQCGFASTMEGNEITVEAQRAKLELIVRTAEKVWGHA